MHKGRKMSLYANHWNPNFQSNNSMGGVILGQPNTPLMNGGARQNGSMFGGLQGLELGLQGLSTLGGLWNAWQANKLAKQSFNFTKEITNTNLNNQIKSYNTTLEDRTRARGAMEGQDQATMQSYLDKNLLTR